jgi:PBSX family phage terminase large subunit
MANALEFKPHPKQAMMLLSPARYIAAITGKQAGKTTAGAIWLIREIKASRDRGEFVDFMICGPSVKILNQGPLEVFSKYFNLMDWGEFKEGKQQFELKWGNKIYVRSADDPKAIESMTLGAAWLDEAGQMQEAAWHNTLARVAAKQGRVLVTTTPYSCNWLKASLFDKAWTHNDVVQDNSKGERKENIAVYCWTSKDNPGFGEKEYENIRGMLSKEAFDRDYNGNFTRLEGTVYSEFDRERHVVKPFHIPPEWKRFGGLDFGWSSAAACVTVAEKPESQDKDGKTIPSCYYIIRELYGKEIGLKKMADYIESNNHTYTLGDPRGAQEMAELSRAYGVRGVSAADNEVAVGIERVQVLFKQDRLKILSSCPNVIDEIESYHYHLDSMDKTVPAQPVKVHDHAMDAMRYAFSRSFKSIYSSRTHHAGFKLRSLTGPRQTRSTMIQPRCGMTGY